MLRSVVLCRWRWPWRARVVPPGYRLNQHCMYMCVPTIYCVDCYISNTIVYDRCILYVCITITVLLLAKCGLEGMSGLYRRVAVACLCVCYINCCYYEYDVSTCTYMSTNSMWVCTLWMMSYCVCITIYTCMSVSGQPVICCMSACAVPCVLSRPYLASLSHPPAGEPTLRPCLGPC